MDGDDDGAAPEAAAAAAAEAVAAARARATARRPGEGPTSLRPLAPSVVVGPEGGGGGGGGGEGEEGAAERCVAVSILARGLDAVAGAGAAAGGALPEAEA